MNAEKKYQRLLRAMSLISICIRPHIEGKPTDQSAEQLAYVINEIGQEFTDEADMMAYIASERGGS